MRRPSRSLAALLLGPSLVACAAASPPDPATGFDLARDQPFHATQAEVLAAGGRLLDGPSVQRVVARLGEQATLAALGARPGEQLFIDARGRLCRATPTAPSCCVVIADGEGYRLFDENGAPVGSLTPSRG